MRVLLTGMSAVGKSTVLARLRDLGHATLDADAEGFLDEAAGAVWREEPLRARLEHLAEGGAAVFLAGCAPNQGRFYPDLDLVVLLTAPAAVVRERLQTRTTNSFGQGLGETERVLADLAEVEPLLRPGADLVLDTSVLPVEEVVDQVLVRAGLGGARGTAP